MAAKDQLKDFVDRVASKIDAMRGQEVTIDQLQSIMAVAEQCSRIIRNLEGVPDVLPENPATKQASDDELIKAAEASFGSSPKN